MERKRGKKSEDEMAGCFGLVNFHRFVSASFCVNFDGLFSFIFARIVRPSVLHWPRLFNKYLPDTCYSGTNYCSILLPLLFLSLLSLLFLPSLSASPLSPSSPQINEVYHRRPGLTVFYFFKNW